MTISERISARKRSTKRREFFENIFFAFQVVMLVGACFFVAGVFAVTATKAFGNIAENHLDIEAINATSNKW